MPEPRTSRAAATVRVVGTLLALLALAVRLLEPALHEGHCQAHNAGAHAESGHAHDCAHHADAHAGAGTATEGGPEHRAGGETHSCLGCALALCAPGWQPHVAAAVPVPARQWAPALLTPAAPRASSHAVLPPARAPPRPHALSV
jgi:hypothetical protein